MFYEEYTTDWLNSRTIFYNIRTHCISDNINELIDPNHIVLHPEGLCNYLQYGYSVYGQTPIEEIRFLGHDQKISKDSEGRLLIEQLDDPFENLLGADSNPLEIIEEMDVLVNEKVEKNDCVIVPTSGGFDSRFIDSVIHDKEKVHAFTYGISKIPSESLEVVYAKKLCEIIGLKWNEIVLGDYIRMIDEWDAIFGISTHSHGMYQMEFYLKVKKNISEATVFSGLFGDIWAGNWDFPNITSPDGLIQLGKSYVEHVDPSLCLIKANNEIRDKFFEDHKHKLMERNWRVLEAGRKKITLISYLMRIPEHYGYTVWSPFLNKELVAKMLNLDWRIKTGRKWQVDYFRKKNLLIGELGLKCDSTNFLNNYALLKNPPKKLNIKLLGTVIKADYVEYINRQIDKRNAYELKYWYGYMVLYPLQKILEIKEYGRKL